MKPSKRFALNENDYKKWGKNAVIFSLPLLILFLTELQKGTDIQVALKLVYAAFINVLIDLGRKYMDGK